MSCHPVRPEWYANYQMHPLVQRRRARVFRRELGGAHTTADAVLMWGSWFHPWSADSPKTAYFHYIDQSRALEPAFGEPVRPSRSRIRSHALQQRTYRDCSGIFCMSEWASSQTAAAHPAAASKCQVVGWGPCSVDLSHEEMPARRGDPLILHVSNDFHRKGVDYLIQVARVVRGQFPRARFVVVGRDKKDPDLGEHEGVEFLGLVRDRERLAAMFREASLFLLPHRFDRSPHVLVEAMSCGLPLVASRQGGAIELIDGTGVGCLVEVGDVQGYSDAISSILERPELAHTMGARGKELVRTRYNWGSIAQRIVGAISASVSPATA